MDIQLAPRIAELEDLINAPATRQAVDLPRIEKKENFTSGNVRVGPSTSALVKRALRAALALARASSCAMICLPPYFMMAANAKLFSGYGMAR